jgi:hypothetical protein
MIYDCVALVSKFRGAEDNWNCVMEEAKEVSTPQDLYDKELFDMLLD